jgi:hypothetical protein
VLVGGIVADDHVHLELSGHASVYVAEKGEEFLVAVVKPMRRAMALLGTPAALASTIWARRTSACGRERELAMLCSCVVSSADSCNLALGRPGTIERSPVPTEGVL